jgi:hypothetical protein
MSNKNKPQKAGRTQSGSGNVVIDLGEKIEAKLRQASTSIAGKSTGMSHRAAGNAYRPGGYKPGMFGGYRPWYASGYRSSIGQWDLGQKLGLPTDTKVAGLLTGALVGTAVNRALMRLTPKLIANDSRLLHEGIAFVAGIVPFVVKRGSPMALGVAVPGLVFLGGALADALFDYVGFEKPALRGGQVSGSASAARQKLADIQARINAAGVRPGTPRVVAQAQ